MLAYLPRLAPLACTLAASGVYYSSWRQQRGTPTLEHFRPLPDRRLPGLSVVIAARNEESTLEPALRSLLDSNYPDLQIVLVDDRSEDGTYQVADRVRQSHPLGSRLKVQRLDELPEGWLGKVHALHHGVRQAEHGLVLLTDADVRYSPDALRLAVTAQQVLGVDHLVAAPRIETHSRLEESMIAYFYLLFSLRFRPADVTVHRDAYIGVGAFNLITREALEQFEDLRVLRLQVIDDIGLGRLVKTVGRRQGCVLAGEHLQIRWFEGVGGAVRGLEKNAYAGADYRPSLALLASLGVALPFWLPILLTICWGLAWGILAWLSFAVWGSLTPPAMALSRTAGLGFPIAGAALSWSFLRSAILCEKRGGIRWRDSFYPLAQLREHHWPFN